MWVVENVGNYLVEIIRKKNILFFIHMKNNEFLENIHGI